MQCLICNEKMKKTAMFGVLADACPTCKYVWLDRNEFASIIAADQKTTRTELLARARNEFLIEALKTLSYKGLCQRCGSPVSEVNFHGIAVNKCVTCGGMLFEYKELEKCIANCKKQGWVKKLFNLITR